jgi:hypothetical protein
VGLDHALEEAHPEAALLRRARDHRGRELLVVPRKNHLRRAQECDQRGGLGGLRGLVAHREVEALVAKVVARGGGARRADDLRRRHHRPRGLALHPAGLGEHRPGGPLRVVGLREAVRGSTAGALTSGVAQERPGLVHERPRGDHGGVRVEATLEGVPVQRGVDAGGVTEAQGRGAGLGELRGEQVHRGVARRQDQRATPPPELLAQVRDERGGLARAGRAVHQRELLRGEAAGDGELLLGVERPLVAQRDRIKPGRAHGLQHVAPTLPLGVIAHGEHVGPGAGPGDVVGAQVDHETSLAAPRRRRLVEGHGERVASPPDHHGARALGLDRASGREVHEVALVDAGGEGAAVVAREVEHDAPPEAVALVDAREVEQGDAALGALLGREGAEQLVEAGALLVALGVEQPEERVVTGVSHGPGRCSTRGDFAEPAPGAVQGGAARRGTRRPP